MYNVINPGIFPKNEEDAKALVTSAAYAPFRSNWYSGLYASSQGGIHVISDMSTDIGDCQWDDAVWPDMIQMNFTANSGGLTTTYEVAPRVSREEMVKFIEDDLKAAIAVLPATYKVSDTNYGRFTKGLAYTVLMKLYMHEQNWAKAVECGRELMKPEYGYRLMDNYKDIFTLENEGNAETIWACVCSRSVNQQMWLAHVISSEYPTKNPNIQKWGGYRVLWDFYHTFDSADKRLEVLVGDFVAEDGTHYNEENPGSVLIKGAMPVKYGEDPDATGEESQVDWIVYRYADVLTLLAEAIVREGNTVTPEAVELLNMVHTRAGLPAYTMADFAGADAFLEAVLTERGHELWFEGVRRSDLIRYGRYIEYARKYKQSPTAQDYMTLMPLPQSVIDESKGKIIQNPGY